MPLPDFLPPMLATLGREPFDSDQHLFEIKWDGIRALTFTEGGGYRALTRNRMDLVPRYPELAFLADLPAGYLLDGELICLEDGRPRFQSVLQREQARNPLRIEALAASLPASYVVFDLVYAEGESIAERPLLERRALLEELVASTGDPRFIFSDGLVGTGRAFFEQVGARGLEGMVAKELSSPYTPGRRGGEWTKVKTSHEMVCCVLGYLSEGDEVRSLIVAAEEKGALVCVGRVGSGLGRTLGRRLFALFQERPRTSPLIECDQEGNWVEPGFFCRIRYLERTEGGLRAPVFLELLQEPD